MQSVTNFLGLTSSEDTMEKLEAERKICVSKSFKNFNNVVKEQLSNMQ